MVSPFILLSLLLFLCFLFLTFFGNNFFFLCSFGGLSAINTQTGPLFKANTLQQEDLLKILLVYQEGAVHRYIYIVVHLYIVLYVVDRGG